MKLFQMNLYCVTDTRRLWWHVTEAFSLGFKHFCPKRERARLPPGTRLVSPPRVLSTQGWVEVIIVCERHNFNLGKGGEGVLYGRERGAR